MNIYTQLNEPKDLDAGSKWLPCLQTTPVKHRQAWPEALLITHIDAINILEDIISYNGVSGTFIGPYDLSGSMGKPGDYNDDEKEDEDKYDEAYARWSIFPWWRLRVHKHSSSRLEGRRAAAQPENHPQRSSFVIFMYRQYSPPSQVPNRG
mgnify:CR=1 FL=1